jgi:high-affinity Fe2+/Pb2+ permease
MANLTSTTQRTIRTPRAAAVAGIAFSVLLTIVLVLIHVAAIVLSVHILVMSFRSNDPSPTAPPG